MIRLARFLLVSALMISIGAQWAVLQSAAWVTMAVSYSLKTGSVAQGLSQTFDGDHPCPLCCVVNKGTESEKKDPRQKTAKLKIELFAQAAAVIVIRAPVASHTFVTTDKLVIEHSIMPPTPPPRCGIA
ncbi:MAG: hypothetical protein JNM99_00945 [Verrucomicrobiaceae bacterium]|nr:hypothetical protein [Verrucomicrobiaceae bacterium]